MAITSIMRDWGVSPAIVRITTSNTLSEVAQTGYVTSQEQNISDLNHGTFEWLVGDLILIAASDGDNFFQFTGNDFSTFVPVAGGGGGGVSSITGTANQVIASAPTGAVTLSLPQDIATTSTPTFGGLTLSTPLVGSSGGTGVNNGSHTATFAGNLNFANAFTTSGNFAVTQTYTGSTNVTFPTSGTLATLSDIPTGVVLLDPGADQNIISGSLNITNGSLSSIDTIFVGDPTGVALGAGTIQFFSDGVNKGSMLWTVIDNIDNFFIQIQNDSYGQSTYLSIPDPANADGKFLIGPGLTPFISGNIPVASGTSGIMVDSGIAASSIPVPGGVGSFITTDITINASDLNSGGQLFLENPSPGKSYKIRNAMVNLSTGMSGGGGDQGVILQDGLGLLFWVKTTLVQTTVNTLWGQTNFSFSPSDPQNRTSDVGAGLWFTYFGGSTDYASGSIDLTVTYERVS